MNARSTDAAQGTKKNTLGRRLHNDWQIYAIMLLPLLWLLVFSYVPMYGVLIGFTKYNIVNGLPGSKWIGLDNFRRFFTTPSATATIYNTITLSVYSLLAGVPCPILLAVLLNECRNVGYKKTVQMITYAPYFISTVVLVAMMMQMFDQRSGIINRIINSMGFKSINFMASKPLFKHMYVWSGIWQGTGFNAIIYLAALSSVDVSQHEAAIIDGASRLQRVWYIDLPSLVPTMTILFILNCGSIMNVGFEKVYLMQNSANAQVSEVLSTYIYKLGLLNLDYGYSAAVNLFNSLVNFVLVVTVNTIARKMGGNSLW